MLTFAPVNLLFIKNIVIMKTKILLFAVMLFGIMASADAVETYDYSYGDTRYRFMYFTFGAAKGTVEIAEFALADGACRSVYHVSAAQADAKRAELEALIAQKEELLKFIEEWLALLFGN
jgi:tetrahydromethanopterin S-methyltransferase subunit E